MRVLDPILDAALEQLGASPAEKAALVGFLANQAQSARSMAEGMRNNAAAQLLQAEEVDGDVERLETMLEKFTNVVPDAPQNEGE